MSWKDRARRPTWCSSTWLRAGQMARRVSWELGWLALQQGQIPEARLCRLLHLTNLWKDTLKVQLKEPIGKGMFGELYRGVDALGIDVAVKFIRQTGVQADFALNQAKALARAMHPNVVAVYTFEDIHDPVTGKEQPAILMEMVE